LKNRDYHLTKAQRDRYREITRESAVAKKEALKLDKAVRPVNVPKLDPSKLMPQQPSNGLRSLSLFSGGGGLDLGFERAGYTHVASFDILDICGETIKKNRPAWDVFSGKESGDVSSLNASKYFGEIDVVHGGPPCQPFSIAGQQAGEEDERDMWGPFVRIVNEISPPAFVAENVPGILENKFQEYVRTKILKPLSEYHILSFKLVAGSFGVPQKRARVFFVGLRSKKAFDRFKIPAPTHDFNRQLANSDAQQKLGFDDTEKCMGMREALGLKNISKDALCPTIRSAFTGKRNTTSILNSAAAAKNLSEIGIWGNGVAPDRESASKFPTKDGTFRLSVQDCQIVQGFPEEWVFEGPVFKVLGQIGNSVAPSVAYQVALALAKSLDSNY